MRGEESACVRACVRARECRKGLTLAKSGFPSANSRSHARRASSRRSTGWLSLNAAFPGLPKNLALWYSGTCRYSHSAITSSSSAHRGVCLHTPRPNVGRKRLRGGEERRCHHTKQRYQDTSAERERQRDREREEGEGGRERGRERERGEGEALTGQSQVTRRCHASCIVGVAS